MEGERGGESVCFETSEHNLTHRQSYRDASKTNIMSGDKCFVLLGTLTSLECTNDTFELVDTC